MEVKYTGTISGWDNQGFVEVAFKLSLRECVGIEQEEKKGVGTSDRML